MIVRQGACSAGPGAPPLAAFAAALAVLAAAMSMPLPTASAGMPKDPGAVRATVNICDTTTQPNVMGLRAQSASTSKKDVLYMRFRVQWFNSSGSQWENFSTGGDSGWIRVGRGAFRRLESGYSFTFEPPAFLRGVVDFRWRQRGRIVDEASRFTRKGGFKGSASSDPPGYAKASCEIKQP